MRKKLFLMALPLLSFTFLISGCGHVYAPSSNNNSEEKTEKNEYISKNGFLLDTIIDLKIYNNSNKEILDDAFDMLKAFELKFSAHNKNSELYKLNHNNGKPTKLSKDVIECIKEGIKYCILSKGAFDIAIGSISLLWNFDDPNSDIPDKNKIKEGLYHVDYNKIHINNDEVTLEDPNMMLDLGAIAKGYIADKLKSYLIEKGVNSAIINLGGNVLTIGDKSGKPFAIGIQDPNGERNKTIDALNITDESVVTSGVYERYIEKDGKKYHHILDPKTGFPADNHILQTTIISKKSVDADALSTTVFLLGKEKGLELINKLDNTEACIYMDDGSELKSKNFDNYLIK